MTTHQLTPHVEAVRRFTRFYTRKLGVLHEHLLDGPFSLTEGRIVYELAHRKSSTGAQLSSEIGLDPSYLSRLLNGLEKRGMVSRTPSATDKRENLVSLTTEGQAGFALINARSTEEVQALLAELAVSEQNHLVNAMDTIERLLGDRESDRVPYVLRPHQPGDIGWVIHRHGLLYAQEYGWDETFEALVAEIASKFLQNFNAKREYCWIAERNGENVGSVFVVRDSDEIAKLRLLLVDPSARGLGIGKRLVEECIRFARLKGYRMMTLWTNDILVAARHIYEDAGFKLVSEEHHHSFGRDLVGQNWNLDL